MMQIFGRVVAKEPMVCTRFDVVTNGPQNVDIANNTTVKTTAPEICDESDYTVVVDSNTTCYAVPDCPKETTARGGRCFCLGLDFTHGMPSADWDDVRPCLKEIPCPMSDSEVDVDEIWQRDEARVIRVHGGGVV